jgi:hypothetical protein
MIDVKVSLLDVQSSQVTWLEMKCDMEGSVNYPAE